MRRRSRVAVVPAVLLAAALGACSSSSSSASPSSSATASTDTATAGTDSASASATASASTSASPSATASLSASTTTAATKPVLILEPDGLGVLVGAASIRHVPFGTDVSTVRTVATGTLGGLATTKQSECGQGPRTQLAAQGFSMLVDGSKFVGWFDSGQSAPRLTTGTGLGVGSTLAQVKASLAGVRVATDTLGPEWTTESGLNGLLDGTSPTSKVTGIYAGESCFFR